MKLLSSRMLHGRFLFASPPCIPDLLMAKDFKASVLHVFELSICFAIDSKELSSILDCFGDKKKAIKNTKTYTIWLEMLAKVLNMLIGLKGNNYYSKVFKRVNYKLSNSTFWVVFTMAEMERLVFHRVREGVRSASSSGARPLGFQWRRCSDIWGFPTYRVFSQLGMDVRNENIRHQRFK